MKPSLPFALLTLAAAVFTHELHYSRLEIEEAVNKKIVYYGSLLKIRNLQTTFMWPNQSALPRHQVQHKLRKGFGDLHRQQGRPEFLLAA